MSYTLPMITDVKISLITEIISIINLIIKSYSNMLYPTLLK